MPDAELPEEGTAQDPAAEEAAGAEPHVPEGLELARDITRATAGAATTPARRRRRPGSGGPALPGRSDRAEGFTTGRHRVSGAHPDDRDPQLLDSTLAKLVGDRGWELDLRVRGVFARWPELVGEEIAQHCRPESFADGRLEVRTDATAWATQLRLLAPQLVRRLNEELGDGTVTVIEVRGPHGPSWTRGQRTVRGARGPRDTYG